MTEQPKPARVPPRFAVAMFDAKFIEGDNDPKTGKGGPLRTFAWSCEDDTHKTPPLTLEQQGQLGDDLRDFMEEWLEQNASDDEEA